MYCCCFWFSAVKAQTVEGKKELLPESKKELLLAVENLEQAVEGIKVNSSQQKTVDSSVESIFEALATAHMKLRLVSNLPHEWGPLP